VLLLHTCVVCCTFVQIKFSIKAKFHYASCFGAGSSWNLAYHLPC